jgi:hypothetical protein
MTNLTRLLRLIIKMIHYEQNERNKFQQCKAEPLENADTSMFDLADLNAGNELTLRTIDGKLLQQSICLKKKQPVNTLLVKRIGLIMIGEGSLTDVGESCSLK